MSFILLVLILLIAYVVLTPFIRVYGAVRKARKQMNDFYGAMNGGGKSAQQQAEPLRREKKIDANVGEYVEFEEIEENTEQAEQTSSDYTHKNYPTEQVEDAEWEDIK